MAARPSSAGLPTASNSATSRQARPANPSVFPLPPSRSLQQRLRIGGPQAAALVLEVAVDVPALVEQRADAGTPCRDLVGRIVLLAQAKVDVRGRDLDRCQG